MALESRGSRSYYYKSVRRGRRVVKKYLGAGLVAELQAKLDATERGCAVEARLQVKAEQARILAEEAAFKSNYRAVDLVVKAALLAAGYHQHTRGEWRRRRG